jgi:hypothetical protein
MLVFEGSLSESTLKTTFLTGQPSTIPCDEAALERVAFFGNSSLARGAKRCFPKKKNNPMKNMLSTVFAYAGVFVACLPAFGQASNSTTQGLAPHPGTQIVPLTPMAVPGTSASNPFSSFAIWERSRVRLCLLPQLGGS